MKCVWGEACRQRRWWKPGGETVGGGIQRPAGNVRGRDARSGKKERPQVPLETQDFLQ